VLPHIISQTQSAFIPGRLIIDNVLLAYEITHMMHKIKGGSDGLVAVKIDMSKAYDRMEWSFLEKIMEKMGFVEAWIKLVMNYVRSVSYRVKVNGNLEDPLHGRERDPLGGPFITIFIYFVHGRVVGLAKIYGGRWFVARDPPMSRGSKDQSPFLCRRFPDSFES
jgi:hypothetical protein